MIWQVPDAVGVLDAEIKKPELQYVEGSGGYASEGGHGRSAAGRFEAACGFRIDLSVLLVGLDLENSACEPSNSHTPDLRSPQFTVLCRNTSHAHPPVRGCVVCDVIPVDFPTRFPNNKQEAVIPEFIANPTIKFNPNQHNTLYHNQNHNNQPILISII